MAAVLCSAALSCRAADMKDFNDLKSKYDAAQDGIAATYYTIMNKASARYDSGLDDLLASFQKDGNLDGALAVKNEKTKLTAKGLAACIETPSSIASLASLQKQLVQQTSQSRQQRDNALSKNAAIYTAQLKDMVAALTKAGKLDDAVKVREELESVGPFAAGQGDQPARWISSSIPRPDAEGWIKVFDGRTLSACNVSADQVRMGAVNVRNGILRLDRTTLMFKISGKDVAIRAKMKKLYGRCLLGCRVAKDGVGGYKGTMSDLKGWLRLGKQPVSGDLAYLNMTKIPDLSEDFIQLELDAKGTELNFLLNGKSVMKAKDLAFTDGQFQIAVDGETLFESIEVKVLSD